MAQTVNSAGTSEAVFVQMVRDDIEDNPLFVGTETVVANGSSVQYRVPTFPIYDGDAYGSTFWKVTVNSVQANLSDNKNDLAAGKVWVDYQNGIGIFGTTPPNGQTVAFTHSKCRWLDRRITKELQNGLRAMFPTVAQKQTDTSITLQTNVWDYTLPTAMWDPRVTITGVEIQLVPNATEPYNHLNNWRRVGLTQIHLPESQAFDPNSKIRLTYWGPYQNVSELEDQLQNLPVLYAKGMLLMNKEAPRARADQAAVTQGESATPPATQSNVAISYLRQFELELSRLKNRPDYPSILSSYGR